MILVDNRAGSKELVKPLSHLGLTVSETTLDFGDIAFEGRGTKGVSVGVGIEFKQLEEFLQALRSGRFVGHQLAGMLLAYDFRWLVVEGEWRIEQSSGLILVERYNPKTRRKEWLPARPRMTVTELDKQLLTLQLCGGLTGAYFTPRPTDTLRVITTLYRWFCDRDMDAHTSHLTIYRPAPAVPVSDFRTIITGIPEVGWKVSLAAEKKFGSVRRAIAASPKEWADLETLRDDGKLRRVGEKIAAKIVASVS